MAALTATGLTLPQINTMDEFGKGVNARQTSEINQQNLDISKQKQYMDGLGNIAAGAAYATDPKTGQVDPAKWAEVVDTVSKSGADVAKFRDQPQLAPMLLKLSLTTQQQIANAHDQATVDLAIKNYGLAVQGFQQNTINADRNYGLDAQRLQLDKDKAATAAASGGYDSPEKFALQPTYYTVTMPDGKKQVLFGTLGDRGTFKPVPLPDGGVPAVPVQQLNTGTDFTPRDKFGNAVADAPVTPINNAQAAEDTALGKGAGEAAVAKPALKSKAQGALSALDDKTKLVGDTIDTVVSQVNSNPTFTTGTLGDWSKQVAGTPGYDVYQNLLTIKSNIGFDKLAEMRANSPTGGALGQVSDTEEALLQAVDGALAQGQSKSQFLKNLARVKELQAKVLTEQHVRFDRDFADKPAGTAAQGAPGAVADWTSLDWSAP